MGQGSFVSGGGAEACAGRHRERHKYETQSHEAQHVVPPEPASQ
jgi:hypothetical protein